MLGRTCAIAALSILALAPAASAQLDTGFEPPSYLGSPDGVELSGQDGWYRPGGVDMRAHTSQNNVLGLPPSPGGQEQFAGGYSLGGPQAAARAQHDMDFSGGGEWWGVHNLSPTIPTFFNIGTTIVTLTSGTNPYTIVWTPNVPGHQCLEVDIGSCNDPNGSNNTAARNLGYVSSPVDFELRNTLTAEARPVVFDVVFADPGWTIEIDPPTPILAADDCPITMTVLPRPPFGAPDGETTRIDIGASIDGALLGGVSIQATM